MAKVSLEKDIENLKEIYTDFKRCDCKDYADSILRVLAIVSLRVKKKVRNKKKLLKIHRGNCPKCDALILEPFEYCPNCGQALDWSVYNG